MRTRRARRGTGRAAAARGAASTHTRWGGGRGAAVRLFSEWMDAQFGELLNVSVNNIDFAKETNKDIIKINKFFQILIILRLKMKKKMVTTIIMRIQ